MKSSTYFPPRPKWSEAYRSIPGFHDVRVIACFLEASGAGMILFVLALYILIDDSRGAFVPAMLFGLPLIIVGEGLRRQRKWGHTLSVALFVIAALGTPFGVLQGAPTNLKDATVLTAGAVGCLILLMSPTVRLLLRDKDLRQAERRIDELESELDQAREMQMALMPTESPYIEAKGIHQL